MTAQRDSRAGKSKQRFEGKIKRTQKHNTGSKKREKHHISQATEGWTRNVSFYFDFYKFCKMFSAFTYIFVKH